MLTIFVMHFPDLPGVPALLDNIVVELIPETCGSELWPGKFGEWIKIHAIDIQPNDVKEGEGRKQLEQCPRLHDR